MRIFFRTKSRFFILWTSLHQKGKVIVPDKRKSGVQRVCQVCSCAQCAMQIYLVYCGSLPSPAHVESCEAETCLLHPGHPSPSSQVTTDSVYLQPSRGMDLVSAHLVDSGAAKSGIWGFRVVYVHIVLYFSSSNTVSWNTLKLFIHIVLIVVGGKTLVHGHSFSVCMSIANPKKISGKKGKSGRVVTFHADIG